MKILVLGSGVIGVTTAFYLARDGHEVTVVDRQAEAASETSYANAGLVAPGHAFAWASPRAPGILLKSLFRADQALRLEPTTDPRMMPTCGPTRGLSGETIFDADGNALVTADRQLNPTGAEEREIVLFDHDFAPLPGTSGDDVIGGGADDDVVFGQLGDDAIQGDGSAIDDGGRISFGGRGTHVAVEDRAGAGDDAMSGAEAQVAFYDEAPHTVADPLGFDAATRNLAACDADDSLAKVDGFQLNSDACVVDEVSGAPVEINGGFVKSDDGKDRPFGDVGNDWLVGAPTVNRLSSPNVRAFATDLGFDFGMDLTRTEPSGELGIVTSADPEWGDQHGSPRDPQPGNVHG